MPSGISLKEGEGEGVLEWWAPSSALLEEWVEGSGGDGVLSSTDVNNDKTLKRRFNVSIFPPLPPSK